MAHLFDTDSISGLLRRRPAPGYVEWLGRVPREDQFTSAVVVGELYKGAVRARTPERHPTAIDGRVLTAVTPLPYDVAVARVTGRCGRGWRSAARSWPMTISC